MTAPSPVASVRGAVVRYGALRALDGVDLAVAPGEQLALVGPSGAGKSTLLGLLNGTLAPAEGAVEVLGRDLARASPRELRAVQRRIGSVHQRLDLSGQLRVVHNVNAGRLGAWPLWRAALSLVRPHEPERAAAALARVGIADRLHERTDRLSGGEQQRVAIARVLVQQPALVLADEPIASLDPARGSEVLDLLREAARASAAALVVSLHDVEAALSRFERVVALREGRVVHDGPPAALSDERLAWTFSTERTAGA